MPDQTFICHGTDIPSRPWIDLRAGPLTMQFDPETPALRRLRFGEHEVVRGIYGAVRDHNWETARPRVDVLQVRTAEQSFDLEFEGHCQGGEVDFVWRGAVAGGVDGEVRFVFDGEARAPFRRNRIGLCVLHPITECAGRPCTVEHVDGTVEANWFPQFISPAQPFKQIRAITHEVSPGVQVEVRFEGEVFEMEDQRNWTDASFKTYGTPLELPFPVRVGAGARIRQTVTVRLLRRGGGAARSAEPKAGTSPHASSTELAVRTAPSLPLPALGLGLASHAQPLAPKQITRLKLLRLAHLRADLVLRDTAWRATFQRATHEAEQLGTGLHVALHLSDDAERELDDLVETATALQPHVLLWMLFHVAEKSIAAKWVQLARGKLAPTGANIPVAAGTNAYFAELNRGRPPQQSNTLPCFSITPQVHVSDAASLIENLGAQAATVHAARQFSRHPVVISPVTLRPRFNPNATGLTRFGPADELPSEVDPRQMSMFGAAWTLGSLARLLTTGEVHSLTYYETTGWRGVMETEAGSPLPGKFPSINGAVFPLFFVFADLAGFDRAWPVHTSHPLRADAVALGDARGCRRVLVANFLAETQLVRLRLAARRGRLRVLDAARAEDATRSPERFHSLAGDPIEFGATGLELTLPAYAVARVDLE
ncbi:MAG: hypothetical protein ACYDH9_09975 [Limisphaerales bacterium]